MAGKSHFGAFHRRFGLAKTAILTRLRTLEARGILEAVPASDGGAYREYRLTQRGRTLRNLLGDAMAGLRS